MSRQIMKVAVLGSSSRMGQAQVRELVRSGYQAVAVTRHPDVFAEDAHDRLTVTSADFDDPASLDAALGGVDAVFFQAPSFGRQEDLLRQTANVRDAALRAGVRHFVFNTTGWTPDEPPCGEPWYDMMKGLEELLGDSALPLTVFRPVLLMDNLLTGFIKPSLIGEGVFRYCHPPTFQAAWISSGDLAAIMVSALSRPQLIGQRFTVGGPANVQTGELLKILSAAIGKPIAYEYLEPRAYGEYTYANVGDVMGDRDTLVNLFDSFYSFNIHSPHRPMEADMTDLAPRLGVSLTSLEDWAAKQDWRLEARQKTGSGGA